MPSEQSSIGALEAIYSKAAKAELESDWDQAFRLYIKTAESYLHLSRTTTDESLRARCKVNAGKSLERAEKIKMKKDLAPAVLDPFSTERQFYVLKHSSRVNNLRYSLWDEPPPPESHSVSAFEDPDGQPKLSLEQSKALCVWRRSSEVVPPASMEFSIPPDDITQHIVTDCSVCASLSVCLEHHRRFGSKLGLSSTYPQDTNGIPCLSDTKRYDLRLFLNGAYRRIVIDDQLPYHPDGNLMCMSTRSKRHLWPSLVEKAYMKVMGGYDFPGSHSCIDIHVLTGWIPEHISIKGSDFQREKTWYRIISGFSEGRCVLTVGTGQRTDINWRGVVLPASHCFAVTDVREKGEERRITILDSWVPGSSDCKSSQHQKIIDILWDDVCDIFDEICLNWDPGQFKHQLSFHGMWLPKIAGEDDGQASCRHLQLILQKATKDNKPHDVWVLLTRHLVDTRRTSEYIALRTQSDDDITNLSGTNRIASKGTYTNSSHLLERTEVSQSCVALSIFASYDGFFEDVGFTITAYSSNAISWNTSIPKALYTAKVKGTLTNKNAGGNCSYPTFMLNPQYHLRMYPEKQTPLPPGRPPGPKANLVLTAQGPKNIPFHLTLVWSQGERIVELVENEVAAKSGAYSYGFARVAADLPAGDFTVIVSAFEPSHTGSFSISIECSHRFDFKAIPQEGAGMYNRTVRGAWDEQTAMGGPNFKCYSSNPVFNVDIPSATELKIRLQLVQPSNATPLNITLFPSQQDGSLGPHIATSGPYSDAISGVVTPQVSVQPGRYRLVPSTYSPGVHAAFRLLIYSAASGVVVTPKS